MTTVAVWGPAGAPGRTSLAIALTAELAELKKEVVLVAVRSTLARFAGIQEIIVIPEDSLAFDRALLESVPLQWVSPSAAVRRSLTELAERVRAVPISRVVTTELSADYGAGGRLRPPATQIA